MRYLPAAMTLSAADWMRSAWLFVCIKDGLIVGRGSGRACRGRKRMRWWCACVSCVSVRVQRADRQTKQASSHGAHHAALITPTHTQPPPHTHLFMPMCRSIMQPLKSSAVGLARFLPAMSGAVPWTASMSARPLAPAVGRERTEACVCVC